MLKSLKVGIQTRESIVIYCEVHLFIHVVNVCILHILWRDQCLFFKCDIMFNKKQMNSPILIPVYVCIIRNVYEYTYKYCWYCFDSTVAHRVKAWKHFIFPYNYVYFMTKLSTVHLSALKLKKWIFYFVILNFNLRAVCLPSSFGWLLLASFLYCCNHSDTVGNPMTSMAVSMVFL